MLKNSKKAPSSNLALFSALLAGLGTILSAGIASAETTDSKATSPAYETLAQIEPTELRVFSQGSDPDAPDPNDPDPVPEPDRE